MSTNDHGDLIGQVASYYAKRLADHGATPRGVDWNGLESHELRHSQFLRLIDDPSASVLDLGCGFGDFLRYLRQRGHCGYFTGYDVAPSMIAEAKRLHGESPGLLWKIGAKPDDVADYAIASGIFNVKGNVSADAWTRYVEDTIKILAQSGRRGCAFNVLSLSSDPEHRRDDLFYADPVQMLQFCLEQFGRSVALLQDYGLYEFTIIVKHSGARA
ncbi:class I SAM-dependent methyltransferase [Microvirga sp. TS319]|uniref:class I SAM-dependent methyltransferase n=1 Tax=Microvirga sp. TS319 TaxID=3241165 RepID=UPI003519DE4C